MTPTNAAPNDGEVAILAALRRMGLATAHETPAMAPLAGGVSSDIWRVECTGGTLCVKRALPRLKVAAVWEAPIERNAFEYAWLDYVGARFPACVPKLLGHDPEAGLFAMAYLDPEANPVWKRELSKARVEVAFATHVGRALAAIHAATANDATLAARFATDASFHALRLEPYLLATAEKHADVAPMLRELVRVTAATRHVLVHGDISPKNILCGEQGPIFLDAECAWFGDPAFDIAFCSNHLLLKCLWVPSVASQFLQSFDALTSAYLAGVDWEPRETLEMRAARLLPGLFLARIDGKSPVEYVTDDASRDRVRRIAKSLLLNPPTRLAEVADAWKKELKQ
jgi:aminoglycoside phosphotransferase (APT) family kinase protein